MVIFLTEDSDKALTNHIPWHLPNGIRLHLEKIRDSYEHDELTKNHTTKEAWDHLNDILDMDGGKGISFHEMKRMKHWFDKHQNSDMTTQYILYGGNIMKTWVDNQLHSARLKVKQDKEALRAMGKSNAFKKEHDADRQTTVTKVDSKVPTYNPATGRKLNRLKELTDINEGKVVVLNEQQGKLISTIYNQ